MAKMNKGETYDVNLRLNEHRTRLAERCAEHVSHFAKNRCQWIANFSAAGLCSQLSRKRWALRKSTAATWPVKFWLKPIRRAALRAILARTLKKFEDHFDLPPGYRFATQGANKDMAESAGYALTAITLSIVFIYIVLGSQFNSFIHPAAIMASFAAVTDWGFSGAIPI